MYKLLIVDDEPIVRIALNSILNWSDYDIEIIGTAANGAAALELMDKQRPDIVICDIKMPVMGGFELVKLSLERFGRPPLFIMLTSFEEFELARQAIHYQVVDYLIKLDLDKNTLSEAILKAKSELEKINTISNNVPAMHSRELHIFHDKFFLRLIHNLFEDEEQMLMQARDLNITFDYKKYIACHGEVLSDTSSGTAKEQWITRCQSSVKMLHELILKYNFVHISSLDVEHFCIIFCFTDEISDEEAENQVQSILNKTMSMVHNYFNIDMLFSVGQSCILPKHIADSYQQARQVFSLASVEKPIVFYTRESSVDYNKNVFNLSLFRSDIVHAFEEYDTATLSSIFDNICTLFMQHSSYYLQAIDAACNILYLAITLLPDGETIVSEIFANDADGYQSIHKKANAEQVVEWLHILQAGLVSALEERRKAYKNHTVNSVQKYIKAHIDERLSLNDVSAAFGISPNYLSMLFKKYSETGFSEYITQCKIEKAKELMKDTTLKVYEISDMLNFESAFYFSKVFKKVTGCSPKDYMQSGINFSDL